MHRLVTFVMLGFLVGLVGCTTESETVVEVEGIVTGPDGKPLKNILVQYFPTATTGREKVLTSTGITDSTGKYVLKCETGKPGAVLGEHKVTLADNDLAEDDDANLGKANRIVKKNRIPLTYTVATTTPVVVTVESGKKQYDLKIK